MTDFNEIHKSALNMQEEFNRAASEFQNKMRKTFTDLTRSFFEAAPEIKLVVWNQYTPYFNDGEECVFSVHDQIFLADYDKDNLEDAYSYEGHDDEFDFKSTEKDLKRYIELNKTHPSSYYESCIKSIKKSLENPRHSELCSLCEGLSALISNNQDLMKSLFGDHVTVYLTKDKSFTNEFAHD